MIAAFYPEHPHHGPSFGVLRRSRVSQSACALHSLAEVYCNLTRMPAPARVGPDQALLYITSLRERLAPIALVDADYAHVLESAAATGLAGAAIYDALLAQCALKFRADVVYTWNLRDFSRLGPEIAARVRTPA